MLNVILYYLENKITAWNSLSRKCLNQNLIIHMQIQNTTELVIKISFCIEIYDCRIIKVHPKFTKSSLKALNFEHKNFVFATKQNIAITFGFKIESAGTGSVEF